MYENIFKSGVTPNRVFSIMGRVARIVRSTNRVFSFLVVPGNGKYRSRYQTDKSGLWLTGCVPADRNPETSMFADLKTGWVYRFDIAPSGNKLKIPDTKYRMDFEIVRVYKIPPGTYGDCSGTFCVSGTVVEVHNDYLVLKSRHLPANDEHPFLEGRYMSVRHRSPGDYYPGQVVLLRVQVYPGSYDKDKNGPIHYAPNAFVLEMHEFRKPGEPFAEPGTYTRRGHWRTSKNGVRHWVRAAQVHIRK